MTSPVPTQTFPDSLDADQVQWQVLPAWNRVLSSAAGLPIRRWFDEGRTSVVKHGPHRTVYRVDLPEGRFYLKHDHSPDTAARGKHLVRASRSRREFDRALEIRRRQVPTVHPVAVGELRRLGVVADSFLLTEAIDETIPLLGLLRDELPTLPAERAIELRRRLAAALARLCARMHRAGVDHDDFHADNILVRLPAHPQAELELFLIDVPGVRLGAALDWPASRDSLAMLCAGLLDRTSLRDRLQFLRAYRRQRGDLALDKPTQRAREVFRSAIAHRLRVLRSRDKRALRSNKDFYRLHSKSVRAHAVSEIPATALQPLLERPERLLQSGVPHPAKLSHSAVVVKAQLDLGSRRIDVACKRSRSKSWSKQLISAVRGNRALRAWRRGHALLARGVATPRPLFVIAPRPGRWWGDGYLATEWLDDALDLHLYAWKLAELPPAERDARVQQAAERIGALLGRMHAWGVRHRDLKANNLMLVEREGELTVYVLDLDGVRICRRVDAPARAADLARLAASLRRYRWISRTARLRFLRAYFRQLPDAPVAWQPFWRMVEQASRRHTSAW